MPGLVELMSAIARGEMKLIDTPRRRKPQLDGLAELLSGWILG